ncbi:MAG: ammonium transporter [Ignavibacteriales bacterium]|nr:ammonium transporter [Ignavibacteriales bacterium]
MFDTGSTGFMLIATSLVMLMTPGLAFFYGGLVGRKNVLAIMIQSFVSLGWTTVIWFAFGYSLCFSGGEGGIIGNLNMAFLAGTDLNSIYTGNNKIPLYVFCLYQMMFAIITPALITGAFANRVRFPAYMVFLTLWLIFVYFPLVHMVWGGGLFTWLILAWTLEKKPKFVGLLTGAVAGLATITPAAGFITVQSAAIIGIVAGIVCYFAVSLKNKMQWDDALDVWGVHGVGGSIGVILLGLFATNAVNPMVTTNGLFMGGGYDFLFKQVVTVLAVCVYAFIFSYVMLWLINFVTPVKVTKEEEEAGLDSSLHGEMAYEQD